MSDRGKSAMAYAPTTMFFVCSTPPAGNRHHISCRRSQRDKPCDQKRPLEPLSCKKIGQPIERKRHKRSLVTRRPMDSGKKHSMMLASRAPGEESPPPPYLA